MPRDPQQAARHAMVAAGLSAALNSNHAAAHAIRGRIENLERSVGQLQTEVARARRTSGLGHLAHRLGHLAHIVDRGAAVFVYGPTCDFYISFMELAAEVRSEGTPREQQRWQLLCSFLSSKGMNPQEVKFATSIVSRLGFDDAPDSEAERAAVTAEQLRQWAPEVLEPRLLPRLGQLLEVVSWFSAPQQPLVLAPHGDVEARVLGGGRNI
jgi:hypothetical protein